MGVSLTPWRRKTPDVVERSHPPLAWNDWLQQISFAFGGQQYPYGLQFTSPGAKAEEIPPSFAGYVSAAYQTNGVVYACMAARLALFSEARFQYRRFEKGRPGALFGDTSLRVLERPWPNATTGDLLARAIQDVDLAGNFYCRRQGDSLYRLRPDWTSIILGSDSDPENPEWALDAQVLGYAYHPGGYRSGKPPVGLLVEEVAHFAPKPDPLARFRGVSWLTTILRELQADTAATEHKLKFFEGGATPNLAVTVPIHDRDKFFEFIRDFRDKSEGLANAYKTLFFMQGAEIQSVGADLKQIDFKVTQGAGETRIAAAAEVPPIIVGLSEGLESATYSNYALAMRRFADLTMRPLWRNFAGSIETVLEVPDGAVLWYDARDIAALKEDTVARADVFTKNSAGMKLLMDAGWDADAIVAAVLADDIGLLEGKHTGLTSVQLQPVDGNTDNGSGNGNDEERTLTEQAARALVERGATQ